MAKANSSAQAAAKAAFKGHRRKSRGPALGAVLIFVLPVLGLLATPMLILVVAGMLPGATAFLLGKKPRHLAMSVIALNVCGVLPMVFKLMDAGMTMENVTAMLVNIFNWGIMYGTAIIGWLIYRLMPPIVSIYLAMNAQAMTTSLKKEQKGLIESWGKSIMTGEDAPPRKPA